MLFFKNQPLLGSMITFRVTKMEQLIKHCPFVSRLPTNYIRKVNGYLPKYAEICPVMSKIMDHNGGQLVFKTVIYLTIDLQIFQWPRHN